MNEYKCIIIEDEPLASEKIKQFVNKSPYLKLVGIFDNSIFGLDFINSNDVDILFLDINMTELNSFTLLENSNLSCQVIISTAYSQFAVKGYDLNVTDYLLKPFTFSRFLQAINKAKEIITFKTPKMSFDFIFIKTENRLEKIKFSDILFIEGMRDYRRIHTINKRIMTLQNFTELENSMPSNLICRIHKSYMVSLNRIESIERRRIKIGDKILPISDTYKERFFSKIHVP